MKVDGRSPTVRSILGMVLLALSLAWGLFGSVWFLLPLDFQLTEAARNNPSPLHYLLTKELGSLLKFGIGAFWPIGGLVFAIYLMVSGRWRPRPRHDLLALTGSVALVLGTC